MTLVRRLAPGRGIGAAAKEANCGWIVVQETAEEEYGAEEGQRRSCWGGQPGGKWVARKGRGRETGSDVLEHPQSHHLNRRVSHGVIQAATAQRSGEAGGGWAWVAVR